jgi:hypothetical protein
LTAQELVVRTLIDILEPSPPADVENQNRLEGSRTTDDNFQKRPQARSMFQVETADPRISEAGYHLIAVPLGELGDHCLLIDN